MIVCYYHGIDYPELITSVSWIIQSIRLSVELENHMVSGRNAAYIFSYFFLASPSFLFFYFKKAPPLIGQPWKILQKSS